MSQRQVQTQLTDVPETMLWTLHNRASEAMRDDDIIDDPDAIRIYMGIDYDYVRSFGTPDQGHAIRSLAFDKQLQAFLKRHPNGVIVNLGEGLETQRFRIKNERALWFSIDRPDAMTIREQFIQPDETHQHLHLSVLDRRWFEAIPTDRPLFITAQGLLMYLPENEVRALLQDLAHRFPNGELMFDTTPAWFAMQTLDGWQKTEHYTVPPMPWGINRSAIRKTLRDWVPTLTLIKLFYFSGFSRGAGRWLWPITRRLPMFKDREPTIVLVRFGAKQ